MAYLTTYPDTINAVRAIEFSPNSSVSFVLAMWEGQCVIYSSEQSDAVQAIVIPYQEEELKDISYAYQVDFLFLAHPNHEPRIIKYDSTQAVGSQFSIEYLQQQTAWKTPPFLREDTTGIETIVSDEVHYVKLVGDNPDTFTGITSTNLNTTPTYIQLRIKNKWAVYRLVDQNVDATVPANPTKTVCYAQPVNAVVDSFAESAQFAMVDNTYIDLATTLAADEREVRCDTLVFNYDLEGAFARIPLDYDKYAPDTRLRRLWEDGVVTSAGTDDEYVWVQLLEYVGQDDFSTALWEGAGSSSDVAKNNFWEVGHIYRIREEGGFSITVGGVVDTAAPPAIDWDLGFTYVTEGDTFALENKWRINSAGASTTKIMDMSRAQTFDIMKTSAPLTMYEPPANANITFDDSGTIHTAKLTASETLWTSADEGRYMMVKYESAWATYKLDNYISGTEMAVEVVDAIPTSSIPGEFELNGRSTQWRLSAWKENDWPYTVAFYEQRLVFGGNPSNPETIWFSKITDVYDFRTVEQDGEVLDTTGITYNIGGPGYNRIRWLSPGITLMIGTEAGEWQLKPNSFREALTPTNVRITQETTEGSNSFAIRAGSALVFPERTGEFIRELRYNFQIDSFQSQDLTLLADHLFRDDAVVDFAYQKTPKPQFWFVTVSGLTYVLTYNTEQEVLAWSRFQTRVGDKVLSVAVMERNDNNPNDRVYFMIQRGTRVYVEYMEDIYYEEVSNLKPGMVFLDNATRFSHTVNTTVFTGLDRFNGESVRVVVDGADVGTVVVASGQIDLADIDPDLVSTTSCVVGYDYTSRYVSNPLSMQVDGGANYGKRARLIKLGGYFYQSLGMDFGIYGDTLDRVEFRDGDGDTNDESPELFTGFMEDLIFDNKFTLENQVAIEQSQPYPLTIICLLPEM